MPGTVISLRWLFLLCLAIVIALVLVFKQSFENHSNTNDTLCECSVLVVDSITYSFFFSLLIALGQNKYRHRNG